MLSGYFFPAGRSDAIRKRLFGSALPISFSKFDLSMYRSGYISVQVQRDGLELPALIHQGGGYDFVIVGMEDSFPIYQVIKQGEPASTNNSGYRSLEYLFKVKGLSLSEH
jgi:hypothetical protein